MKNLLYLLFFILLFSCGKDEITKNSLAGSYQLSEYHFNCTSIPENNIDVLFSEGKDCKKFGKTYDIYNYCSKGKLLINDDNSFSSSTEFTRKRDTLGVTLVLFSIRGEGNLTISGNDMNLCINGGSCKDFILDANSLKYTKETDGCKVRVTLDKN